MKIYYSLTLFSIEVFVYKGIINIIQMYSFITTLYQFKILSLSFKWSNYCFFLINFYLPYLNMNIKGGVCRYNNCKWDLPCSVLHNDEVWPSAHKRRPGLESPFRCKPLTKVTRAQNIFSSTFERLLQYFLSQSRFPSLCHRQSHYARPSPARRPPNNN